VIKDNLKKKPTSKTANKANHLSLVAAIIKAKLSAAKASIKSKRVLFNLREP
jgi:hypothetical protein